MEQEVDDLHTYTQQDQAGQRTKHPLRGPAELQSPIAASPTQGGNHCPSLHSQDSLCWGRTNK